jgi:hypothetical protein
VPTRVLVTRLLPRWTIAVGSAVLLALGLAASSHAATPFFFSTGNPDGLMGMASRPASGSGGPVEIEAADDFILSSATSITSATFTGLLPADAPLSIIQQVRVEIYRVFPNDSDTTRTPNVPTRTNSPSDNEFTALDSAAGTLTFTATLVSSGFTVANTVINGINPLPGQHTGGEGPATGEEVQFSVAFSPALNLPPGHYFFVPQVGLSSGTFLWLSAPKPIVAPGTPFTPDLQAWIRNAYLAPDWLRVGTDIVGSGAFNGTFSLTGLSSTDVTPPMCVLVATVPGPPKQIKIEIQDTGSGLNSVVVPTSDNAIVSVPAFTPDTTSPILVTATKADPLKGSTVALTVTDGAGNVRTCDPRWPGTKRARTHRASVGGGERPLRLGKRSP